MNDSQLADEATILRANLRHAVFNHETLSIGGGEFNAKLVSDILEMYINTSTRLAMQLASQKNLKEDYNNLKETNKELRETIKKLHQEYEK